LLRCSPDATALPGLSTGLTPLCWAGELVWFGWKLVAYGCLPACLQQSYSTCFVPRLASSAAQQLTDAPCSHCAGSWLQSRSTRAFLGQTGSRCRPAWLVAPLLVCTVARLLASHHCRIQQQLTRSPTPTTQPNPTPPHPDPNPQSWIKQVSSFIRQRSPRHLITAGLDGAFGPSTPHHCGRNARLLPRGSLLRSRRAGGVPLDLSCSGAYVCHIVWFGCMHVACSTVAAFCRAY